MIREGGYLFIDQTPSLLFPMELHTTGLALINYLPARLSFWRRPVDSQSEWHGMRLGRNFSGKVSGGRLNGRYSAFCEGVMPSLSC